jgi:hypothetical protein
MAWTAETLYGVPGAPSSGAAAPAPTGQASAAAPGTAVTGRQHFGVSNPTLWVVLLLALAIGLVHVSFRLS